MDTRDQAEIDRAIDKEIKAILADGGTAYDRMNAGQGGEGIPPGFFKLVEQLKAEGLTLENYDQFMAERRQNRNLSTLSNDTPKTP